MKILLNASTIRMGGAIQVTVNFIINTIKYPEEVEWSYVISKPIFEELKLHIENPILNLNIIEYSPASLFKGRQTKKNIYKLISEINPDLIYSIGSPSYLKLKKTEVQRLTNPWVTHPNKYSYNKLSFLNKIYYTFDRYYKIFKLRHTKYFITQTNEAKSGILNLFNIKKENIKVIPNCFADIFSAGKSPFVNRPKVTESLEVCCISHPYPHKNIDIILYIAKELKNRGYNNFHFYVTIPKDAKFLVKFNKIINQLQIGEHIINLGKINLKECYQWYSKTNVLLLPTLLETFSVSLLEAMQMDLFIVATNFKFNKEVCKDAALYYEPLSLKDAVDNLIKISSSEETRKALLNNRYNQLNKIGKYYDLYIETIDFLKRIPK
jgi:glycosyltransferase involved in cell wall biosynthesis